ncbi:unnamed protein product [Rhizophagus irregularis]|nr:unnamed protein product [Rhizophagus irregularis]
MYKVICAILTEISHFEILVTRDLSCFSNIWGPLLPPKKVDILIVLRYSVPLFKGVSFILTISKKFINTETNQYEKSAASKDELSDKVEIVKVARGQTSTTPATGQDLRLLGETK